MSVLALPHVLGVNGVFGRYVFSRTVTRSLKNANVSILAHVHLRSLTCPRPSVAVLSEPQPHPRQSILQFLATKIRHATHRDYLSSRESSLGSNGPRGDSSWQTFRRRVNSLPPGAIIFTIMALNAGVYITWKYAIHKGQSLGDIRLFQWMRDNFTTSLHNLQSGRIWTLLTAAFSHAADSHILFNGLSFYFIAPSLLTIMSNTGFIALYLVGSIACTLTSVGVRWWTGRPDIASLGASGAIYALVSYTACIAPRATFYFFFVLPVPAWALVGGLFAYEGYRSSTGQSSKEDSLGHLGGLTAGVLFYLRMRFRLF